MLVPVSAKLSYAQVELQRPQETRLIGVVDLEIRPLLRFDPAGGSYRTSASVEAAPIV